MAFGDEMNDYEMTENSKYGIVMKNGNQELKMIAFYIADSNNNDGIANALFNRLTPNDPYMGRTTLLTSKRCILYIYSTNIGAEYFEHALCSPFFSSKCSLFHNANLFGPCIIHILYTGCAKI